MGKGVLNKRSSVVNNGVPKAPDASAITYGEIAVNFSDGHERLFIKNNSNEIVSFSTDEAYDQRIGAVETIVGQHTSDISGLYDSAEVTTNKTDIISSASTNTQYPSAAAVYGVVSGITGLPSTTASDEGKVLKVVNTAWEKVMPATIYTGNSAPGNELGNDGDIYLSTVEVLRAPDVIYETDGTTGLLGHNQSSFANQWQLENLNLSPYKYIKCYFKCSTSTDSSAYTPAVVVIVPLDTAAMGSTAYFGGTMTALPFNRNRYFLVSCAVDGTKTKFQVVHQNTIWDATTSDANTLGRYCYKIEGWY